MNLLSDIEMAMQDNSYEMEWYLDMREEKVQLLCDPAVVGNFEEMEQLEKALEEDDGDRFYQIMATSSDEDWRVMERFIHSLDDQDENTREMLLNAIQGSGAFGRFKDAVQRIGLLDRWYEYRNRAQREQSLNWLQDRGLIGEEQVEKGLRLHKEQVQRRKRREMEIRNMTTGRMVRCRDITGHAANLTEGKVYEILDEQQQQLNIRIKGDQGNNVWMPKSHFTLLDFDKE